MKTEQLIVDVVRLNHHMGISKPLFVTVYKFSAVVFPLYPEIFAVPTNTSPKE